MFSVIVCSIDPKRFAHVKAMYDGVFRGHDWELIHIPDARSLAEGYNRGVASSKGDILIFSHDDIEILSPDMPGRLQRHLSNFDLVGVAGTTQLHYVVWNWSGPPYIFGQVAHQDETGGIQVNIYGAPYPVIPNIQAIDGLFMAARRSVFEKVSFDDVTFDGFHHYDLDFSYSAFRAGLRLAVANDICIYHTSHGKYDEVWTSYAQKFHDKWLASASHSRPNTFVPCSVLVRDRAEALKIMTPAYWLDNPVENR
jgi:GT2 family glycosyltransferase